MPQKRATRLTALAAAKLTRPRGRRTRPDATTTSSHLAGGLDLRPLDLRSLTRSANAPILASTLRRWPATTNLSSAPPVCCASGPPPSGVRSDSARGSRAPPGLAAPAATPPYLLALNRLWETLDESALFEWRSNSAATCRSSSTGAPPSRPVAASAYSPCLRSAASVRAVVPSLSSRSRRKRPRSRRLGPRDFSEGCWFAPCPAPSRAGSAGARRPRTNAFPTPSCVRCSPCAPAALRHRRARSGRRAVRLLTGAGPTFYTGSDDPRHGRSGCAARRPPARRRATVFVGEAARRPAPHHRPVIVEIREPASGCARYARGGTPSSAPGANLTGLAGSVARRLRTRRTSRRQHLSSFS